MQVQRQKEREGGGGGEEMRGTHLFRNREGGQARRSTRVQREKEKEVVRTVSMSQFFLF